MHLRQLTSTKARKGPRRREFVLAINAGETFNVGNRWHLSFFVFPFLHYICTIIKVQVVHVSGIDPLLSYEDFDFFFWDEITALPSGDKFPKGTGSREVAGTL